MKTKIYKTIVAGLVGITIFSGMVLASVYSYADNDTAVDQVDITVPVACTMTGNVATGQEHSASLTPGTYSGASGSEYANGIGKTTLTTLCNDNNGFSIYAIGYTGDTLGVNTLVGANTATTIATKAYESTDTISNWSMKVNKVTDSSTSYNPQNMTIVGGFDNYHAVPNDYTKVAEYKSTTEPATTDTTLGAKVETTYATYIATNQPADTYTGKVKYVMVHPYNAEEPVSTAIQNLPAEKCTSTASRVVDVRDGTVYHVQRLADNKCWLLDNLALDLADSAVQAKLTSETTNASNTTLNYLVNGGGTANDQYPTSGVSYWVTGYPYSDPLVLMTRKDEVIKGEGPYGVGDYKTGGFYNFCAASAGSYCWGNGTSYTGSPTEDPYPDSQRDIYEDICPSGWHIPTTSASSSGSSDYTDLAYALSGEYGTYNPSFGYSLSMPFAGDIYKGQTSITGKGIFWTSTWYYTQYFYEIDVTPAGYAELTYGYGARNRGYSIRCVSDN